MLGDTSEQVIAAALPSVFAEQEIRLPGRQTLTVDGSPHAFMDFAGYERLFLLNRPLHLVGRQHGGGYDMFMDSRLVAMERRLADHFIGWGLSPHNEPQHRYDRTSRPQPATGQQRIVWIERSLLPSIALAMAPTASRQQMDVNAIDYVGSELQALGIEFSSLPYPAPLRSSMYDRWRGAELSNPGRGENALCADDIILFDISCASLTHYCIEHDIAFVFVICRDDLPAMTPQARDWMRALRGAKMLYFTDEPGALSSSLLAWKQTRGKLPSSIIEYHSRNFRTTLATRPDAGVPRW